MLLLVGDTERCHRFAAFLALETDGALFPLPGKFLERDLILTARGGKRDAVSSFFARNPFTVLIGRQWAEFKDTLGIDTEIGISQTVSDASWWRDGMERLGISVSDICPDGDAVAELASKLFDPTFAVWMNTVKPRSELHSYFNQDDAPIRFADVAAGHQVTVFSGSEMRRLNRRHSETQVLLRLKYDAHSRRKCDPFVVRDVPIVDRVVSTTPCEFPGLKVEQLNGFGCWVSSKLQLEFDVLRATKTSMVSMIASVKRFLPGHRLRHRVARTLAPTFNVSLLGNGYKHIDAKEEGHVPYYYSIVIENNSTPTFLTEKLNDCLRCGCVALYWGAASAHTIFDKGSVLTWSTPAELETLLQRCSVEDYDSRRAAIQNNIFLAQARCSVGRCLALDTSLCWDMRPALRGLK